MGALPLSFEERPDCGHPFHLLDVTIPHYDAFEDDPTELLATGR